MTLAPQPMYRYLEADEITFEYRASALFTIISRKGYFVGEVRKRGKKPIQIPKTTYP